MLKAERLVAITLLLQSRGKMTAERLASILGVSVRTIYRDMDSLSLAHVPVTMDYGPGGGYFLPSDYRLEPAAFSSDEAVALALGGAIAGGSRLFESGDGLRRALFKLEASLPEEYRADVSAARERILFDTTAWHRQQSAPEYLETVRSAVWDGRQLDILYPRSTGPGVQWRHVEPHGLVCKAGTWYLVAYCHNRRDFRTFRVSRIEEIAVRDDGVTPRPDFDLAAYWDEARQRFEEQTLPFAVTLQITAEVRRHLGGEGVIVRNLGDGGAIVRVNVDSPRAAVSYALSLGPEAKVVDPPETRAAVAAAAHAIAAIYEPLPDPANISNN